MYIAVTCLLGIVAVVVGSVFWRYVLKDAPAWSEQVALILVINVAMFGAAAGVREIEVWSKVGGPAPTDASQCQFVVAGSKNGLLLTYTGAQAGNLPETLVMAWDRASGATSVVSLYSDGFASRSAGESGCANER